jgi:tetratricopeptide (TPR) repeat protein
MESAIIAFLAAIVVFGVINVFSMGKSVKKREEIARNDPSNVENIVKLVMELQKDGQRDKGYEFLKKINLDRTDYWTLMGKWLLMLQHWRVANYTDIERLATSLIEDLEKSSDTEIQLSQAHYLYGAIMFKSGDVDMARQHKKIAIKYDDDCLNVFDMTSFTGYLEL